MNYKDNGLITLSNQLAECKISLWGGNVLSYRPKTQKHDVFWLGALNKFDNVQAIRGGVPVCWPRFAEEQLNNHFPRHGFARLSMWKVKNIIVDEDKIEVALFLNPDEKFRLNVSTNLLIKITDKLEYCLETINHGCEPFCFSEALHAYFNVSSINDIEITGLENHQYKNSLDGNVYNLSKSLKICGEFDSAFQNHHQPVEIKDKIWGRIISVEKSGSETTVVWNPNKDLIEMEPGQYRNFVCVEPSNQGDYFVTLPPKQTHQIMMTVRVDKWLF